MELSGLGEPLFAVPGRLDPASRAFEIEREEFGRLGIILHYED